MKRRSLDHQLLLSAVLSAGLVGVNGAAAGDDPKVHLDGAGDAVLRRTDHGNDGPISLSATLPDLISVTVGGWDTPTPVSNPYQGSWIDIRDTNIFKIELLFDGLVNPPGQLNLRGEGYKPFLYGPNPVFGFVEFDFDREKNTGGEIDNVWNRPLGNASRFGGRLSGSVGERAADTGWDFEGDVTRSGEEAHLSFCGCSPFNVTPINDPTPNTFDAGDTWIVTGRFFHRSHAFSKYSFAFGGSEPGEYDPIVKLRFSHNVNRDETTITFVYAINMDGAAALSGQSRQSIDLNAGNHTSLEEMLSEIRFAALNNNEPPGTEYDLLRDWADGNHDDLQEFLERDDWDVLALFGTTYTVEQQDAIYVWTDVGPEFEQGDCNGDDLINGQDQAVLMNAIAQSDGSSFDADHLVNGQTTIVDFAFNFALHDINYDGLINADDLELIGYAKRGDVNSDGAVNATDVAYLKRMLGMDVNDPGYNKAADLNADDRIDHRDLRLLRGMIYLNSGGGHIEAAPYSPEMVRPPRRIP